MNKQTKHHLVVPFRIESAETKAFRDVKLPDGVERKALGIDSGLEVFEFKGYASTFGNVDRGADVVEKGAFTDFLRIFKSSGDMLAVLWQHQHDNPVGVYVDMFEDEKGLFVHGIMPKSDTFVAERVIPQMQVGSVRKMSIGYWIDDLQWDGDVRRLIKLGLWEISLVTVPMNNNADITEMKKADGSGYGLEDFNSMTERELEKRFKSGVCFSDSAAKYLVKLLKSESVREALEKEGREALTKQEKDAEFEAGMSDILEGIKRLTTSLTGE